MSNNLPERILNLYCSAFLVPLNSDLEFIPMAPRAVGVPGVPVGCGWTNALTHSDCAGGHGVGCTENPQGRAACKPLN